MAFLKVKNRAVSTLASGVSDTDTFWTVATGEGVKFPGSGDFHITCEDEIVKCTARSGDVLTGAVAGLAAQGLPLFEAAAGGVYLHGQAGERVKEKMGDAGMIASDLLPELPLVIKNLKEV